MKLQLTRPLIFLDIEATGIDRENDRIVELSVTKIMPDGTMETKTRRLNPEMPIPAGATEIHGIKDEDVANEKTFKEIAKSLLAYFEGCDIAGFGSNYFDVPMLYNEWLRAGIEWDYTKVNLIDAGNLFKIKEERTLSAAVKFYCNKDHEGAHGAEADTAATIDVFAAQMERYEDLPTTVEEMALVTNYGKKILDLSGKFSYNDAGEIIFNFKYKGERAIDHMDFIDWMYYKANFPPDTRRVCAQLLGV